jgi:hypothetical protein
VRVFAAGAAVALCAACGPSDAPHPAAGSSAPSSQAMGIDLAGVARVRGGLPAGYEVGDLLGRVTPLAFWGFGPQWAADPPQCGVLADPAVDAGSVRGWSASGPGGIVYVVAAAALTGGQERSDSGDVTGGQERSDLWDVTGGQERSDLGDVTGGQERSDLGDVTGACSSSTLTAGHTSGTVAMVEAPAIDGATTVGVRTDTTTVVEGGTETHSHADTFTAYLDGYVAYVTVVTDPGSSEQPLDAGFAAALLIKTVSALRR